MGGKGRMGRPKHSSEKGEWGFKNDSIRCALVGALLYYSENNFFALLWRGCPGGKKTGCYYTKTGFCPPE